MRIAEEIVEYFNSHDLHKTVLDNTVLSHICHINHYAPTIENTGVPKRTTLVSAQNMTEYHIYNAVLPKGNMGVDAYINSGSGRLPERLYANSEGIHVPIYHIASAIDWLEKYDEDKKVVQRAFQILEYSYVKKLTDDMFHCLLSCGVDRNFIVFDSEHDRLDTRLVDLMIEVGANNKSPLTHLIISPEAHESVGCAKEINGIQLLSLDALGAKQEYQNFFENQLEAMFADCCTELVLGIAHGKDGAMIMQPSDHTLKFQLSDEILKNIGGDMYGAYFTDCATGYVCEPNKVLLGSF